MRRIFYRRPVLVSLWILALSASAVARTAGAKTPAATTIQSVLGTARVAYVYHLDPRANWSEALVATISAKQNPAMLKQLRATRIFRRYYPASIPSYAITVVSKDGQSLRLVYLGGGYLGADKHKVWSVVSKPFQEWIQKLAARK